MRAPSPHGTGFNLPEYCQIYKTLALRYRVLHSYFMSNRLNRNFGAAYQYVDSFSTNRLYSALWGLTSHLVKTWLAILRRTKGLIASNHSYRKPLIDWLHIMHILVGIDHSVSTRRIAGTNVARGQVANHKVAPPWQHIELLGPPSRSYEY